MGIIAGILVVAFILLLLAVDVTCFFVNKCGLIMCLCGKPGTGGKGHNMEEGKAAFIKDESKEPIVEVRTEDECTANHNAGGPTEPNETTPLTEPELVGYIPALALDTLSSVATNSDTATATYDPAQDSPCSETTTLTCSLSAQASDPSPTPVPAPAPTPESNTAPPNPLISTSDVTAKMAPLVEQRGDNAPKAEEKTNSPVSTPEQIKPQKSTTPIPPKRRNSPKLAALNTKGNPPVSALAMPSPSASPTPDTKKHAPSPPVTQKPTQTAPAVDTETPVQTSARLPTTATTKPAPDTITTALDNSGPSLAPFDNDKPSDQDIDNDANTAIDGPTPTLKAPTATSSPAVVHNAPKVMDAEESVPSVADILTPIPAATSALTSDPASSAVNFDTPVSTDLLTSDPTTYDFLSPTPATHIPHITEPTTPELELELTNGIESPSLPAADLISLDSPPSAPSLPNGDEAALPASGPALEASETLAKAVPPVNDEYGSL